MDREFHVNLFIEQYNQKIENIEWHIKTNGWSMTDKEIEQCKLRIEDYKSFIIKINQLK